MSLSPIMVPEDKAKKGGFSLGSILGGAVGAIGGAIAGGPAGAATGASAGMSLGGMAGEAVQPSKAAEASPTIQTMSASGPSAESTPLDRMMNRPEVQLAALQDAKKALATEPNIPTPVALNLQKDFETAQAELNKRLNNQSTQIG